MAFQVVFLACGRTQLLVVGLILGTNYFDKGDTLYFHSYHTLLLMIYFSAI